MENVSIPIVERLRARGAQFFWVAMAIGALPFWELHVGIVVDGAARTARSGLHRSSSSDAGARLFGALETGRAARGLTVAVSEAAEETQLLNAPHDLEDPAAIAKLCSEAHDVYAWARTTLEELR